MITMKTLLAYLLAGACAAASAQTPATNPMPDGSRDMYVGLGAVSSAHYVGGNARQVRALPLVQLQWSNGLFISGMSAGMHLSTMNRFEYGPLLAMHAGRDHDGSGQGAGGIDQPFTGLLPPPDEGRDDPISAVRLAPAGTGLAGMRRIRSALQAGAFANFYLTPRVRLTSSVLYGAGDGRDGVLVNLGVQHVATSLGARHRVSLSAGANLVNRSYNQAYFGISDDEAFLGVRDPHVAGGGVRDIYLGAGWNWALSPSWMLVSAARVSQLKGDARRSPLVLRPASVTVSTGLAYRF